MSAYDTLRLTTPWRRRTNDDHCRKLRLQIALIAEHFFEGRRSWRLPEDCMAGTQKPKTSSKTSDTIGRRSPPPGCRTSTRRAGSGVGFCDTMHFEISDERIRE
jgi:hypothetical protein